MTVKELKKQLEESNRKKGMYPAVLVDSLVELAETLEQDRRELRAAVRKACRSTTTTKR